MFGELPKLFDRNFVIGFFLPVTVFITFSVLIINPYPLGTQVLNFLKADLLVGTTSIALVAWVGSIILLALNRDLYRMLEGYLRYNPLKLFGWMEKHRYHRLLKQLEKLDDQFSEHIDSVREFPADLRIERNKLMERLAEEFPDKEELFLPTPFGNVLRSFEVYPRVMYGLEAIDGWGRLVAVIPKDYIELIEAAKAQVDFWVNLGVAFVLLQTEYIVLAFITGTPLKWWVVLLFITLGTIAPLRATSSAREWGNFVKSAFDVFRFDLLKSLGINIPKSKKEERLTWVKYSQAILFRLPDSLPDLKASAIKTAKNKKVSVGKS